MKKWKKRAKKDGTFKPSAVVLSVVIHAGLFLLAGMLVVFTVVKKDVQQFDPPQAVERPKMKLKKPKVRVKKNSRPKSTARIVTKQNRAMMPSIDLPEMSGLGDGLGDGLVGDGGFGIMPDLEQISVFGGGQSIGNDFEGTLYDLKRDRQGGLAVMDKEQFMMVLREFCKDGWNEADLARYYRSPKKLYTTHFIVPPIVSPMAPDAFGDPEMESYWFFVKYKGKLVSKEDITFRFWGTGDAYIVVRVGRKHVLVNGWTHRLRYLDFWQTFAAGSDQYFVGNQRMKVGDWITLKAGEPVEMQLLFGEWEGGEVAASLMVEVEGVEYPSSRQGGPLLPAFKTDLLSQDMLDEIRKYLPQGEVDLEGGPIFNDYISSAPEPADAQPDQTAPVRLTAKEMPEQAKEKPGELRTWNMKNGRMIEAGFAARIGRKVSLKGPRGRLFQIPVERFSDEDLTYIQLESPPQLDLNFSRKTKQRTFPYTHSKLEAIPRSSYYDFSLTVKQTSVVRYDQELTAEFFAIGDEVTGNKHILLDYQKATFVLSKENRRTFEFLGNSVEILDYNLNGQHRGTKYGGYVAVVTDVRGNVVAYKTTKGSFYKNLDNLRNIPVGRYFDKAGNRCTPTRPRPWY